MHSTQYDTAVPARTPMRPAYLLATIGAVMAFVLAMDVWGAYRAERSSEEIEDEILHDATRSIATIADLRWHLALLEDPHTPEERAAIGQRIYEDIEAYEPNARFETEPTTWPRVRDVVMHARDSGLRGDQATVRALGTSIAGDFEELVAANERQARSLTERMALLRRYEIAVDLVTVLIAGSLMALIGVRFSRAHAIANQLMAENLRQAEDRNRELDAFAGRAAHDLRGPLNPIRGYADLIATDANLPPETRRHASLITRSVLRMARIIDDMLALSRAGHPAPGSAAVRSVVTHLREELEADLLEADLRIDVEDVTIGCNENAIEQILRNLIGNASKFRSPERKLQIDVAVLRRGDTVELSVADNGVGMDPASIPHVFDPFFRGRHDIAGTGLGLSIVDRIARACGGGCHLDRERAVGTRVIVTLPVGEARA